MNLSVRLGAFCVFVAMALSACSDIVPGLNVRLGSPGTHAYKVVSDDKTNSYKVVQQGPLPSYEIVPVTPDVIATLVSAPANPQAITDQTLPPLLPHDVASEYKIGPADVLYITVWEHPELNNPGGTQINGDPSLQGRLVASDGTVFYPYVGVIKAAGMTQDDLRRYLTEHLTVYIRNPQVDVRVLAFRSNRVQVTGEVNAPGTLQLDDIPQGILEAINHAGGLKPTASHRRAVLIRNNIAHQIDLSGLLSGSRPVSNPLLQPGDLIHVPDQSADQVFVLGEVVKQGPVILQQDNMTLIEALTQSSGLDQTRAKDAGVVVFRLNGADANPAATVFTVDLGHPDGVLLASQFPLKARDVVYVKTAAGAQFNTVIIQILPALESYAIAKQLTQ